jgi:hypothetical protein
MGAGVTAAFTRRACDIAPHIMNNITETMTTVQTSSLMVRVAMLVVVVQNGGFYIAFDEDFADLLPTRCGCHDATIFYLSLLLFSAH